MTMTDTLTTILDFAKDDDTDGVIAELTFALPR